ncbi:hypothetical protein F5Y14DRAFT_453829 [Nemania sp. NC0429]|nr:hypothetical protein F5Y14DRAFT_453829 [Nemania sp. NC0429]
MSSNSQSYSYSFYSSSSSSSSSSNTRNGGAPRTTTYAERSYTDNTGTRTERMHQLPGERPVYESEERPSGRRLEGGSAGAGAGAGSGASSQNRITDVTDAEKQYEERMEDEYAKREGGA